MMKRKLMKPLKEIVELHESIDIGKISLMYADDSEAIEAHLEACKLQAEQHRQIAEWLTILRAVKSILDADCYNKNSYVTPFDNDSRIEQLRQLFDNNKDK